MKLRILFFLLSFFLCNLVFADANSIKHEGSLNNAPLWAWVIMLVFVAMIIHEIYELFFKPFRKKYSVEYFQIKRQSSSNPFPVEDNKNYYINILEEGFSKWGYYDNDSEERDFLPFSLKEFQHAKKALSTVEKMAPTNPETVEVFCKYVDAFKKANKRRFSGSILLIVLYLLLVAFIMYQSSAFGVEISISKLFSPSMNFFTFSLLLYLFSSCTPRWLLLKRKNSGGNRTVTSRIFGGVFGAIMAMPTYVTVTKWSDGSITKSSDDSNKLVSLAFLLAITMVVLLFLPIIAFLSYLRNYIFYV